MPPTALRPDVQIANAISLYSRGQPREALALMEQLLKSQSRNAGALNVAGTCARAIGQLQAAEDYWRRALKANAGYVEVHYNLGNLLRDTGRLPEAEAAYRRAVALNPQLAEAHINLGILLQGMRRCPEAETAFRRALALRPDIAQAHYNLGNLYQEMQRFPEAEAAYRGALARRADYAEAHYNLGIVLQAMGRLPEAEAAYRQALDCRPDHAKAQYNLGHLFQTMQRLPEAETAYRRALALQPDYVEAHNNLGAVLKEMQRFPEAEAVCRRALALRPDFAEAHNNLGLALKEMHRFPEAEGAYGQALAIDPGYAQAHNNLGILLQDLQRFPEAEAAYGRALASDPGHADASFNLGLLFLRTGRLAEGWPLYEFRYHGNRTEQRIPLPDLPCPQWQGESLAGKSLLVWPEQGFGDGIQFVRYLSRLKAAGASRVTLVCKPPLQALFQGLEGADGVLTPDEARQAPAHDFWTFLLSMPLHLGTTLDSIPAAIPYLQAPPERLAAWQGRLPAGKLRIGLVWKGSTAHRNDRHRSLPNLAALAPLWKIPGAVFVSLQKGQGEEEAATPPPGQPITHLGSDIADFADSAAIVAQLDLVITVDTAIAHLAGALGIPCWVLLPKMGADWRWLDDRADSPWYPGSLHLFRQQAPADWSATILEVAEALRQLPVPSARGAGLMGYWKNLAGKLRNGG